MADPRLLQAAEEALGIPLHYAQRGRNFVDVALMGAPACVALQHYPRADVVDAVHGSRFYYHAHGSHRKPPQEHGHFHLFLHRAGARCAESPHTHLAALSLNLQGQPLRWFVTNRWVTAEHWQAAAELAPLLQDFDIATRGRLAPVARWLSAMVRLYQPILVQLLCRRDQRLARHARQQDWASLLEDRRLDVLVQHRIDLPGRIQQIAC